MSYRILLSPPQLDGDERARLLAAVDPGWVAPAALAAAELLRTGMCLPSASGLSDTEVDEVAEVVGATVTGTAR